METNNTHSPLGLEGRPRSASGLVDKARRWSTVSSSNSSSFYGSVSSASNRLSRHRRGSSALSMSSVSSALDDAIHDQHLVGKITKLDFLGGPKASYRRGSVQGFCFSILAAILAVKLISRELRYSMEVHTSASLEVDSSFTPAGRQFNLSFAIDFPTIACTSLVVGVEDAMGAPQEGIIVEGMKIPLDAMGGPSGGQTPLLIGQSVRRTGIPVTGEENEEGKLIKAGKRKSFRRAAAQEADCGSCLGAGEIGECCNTCQDVKEAYMRMGWMFDPREVPQCLEGNVGEPELSNALEEQKRKANLEGCRLIGSLYLHKAAGNVHFLPDFPTLQTQEYDTAWAMFEAFNTSHTISRLRFSTEATAADHAIQHPLEGQQRSVGDHFGMYQYFLTVVPTTFVPLGGDPVTTFQYSVTEHLRHVEPGAGLGLPGVYLQYEVSLITARIEERSIGLINFLTSTCAVVGGLYALIGLLSYSLGNLRAAHLSED